METAIYNDMEIHFSKNTMNLTHMWKAAGSPANQEPWHWKELPSAKQLIETLCKKLNLGLSEVLKTTRGRYGGTYAHWQVALVCVAPPQTGKNSYRMYH
ncbi:MAG: KilA-N domain-containing protein [Planctomycetota bacterium]|jgi:hypothetical protein